MTLNNWQPADKAFWLTLSDDLKKRIRYVVLQEELSASGTPHFQGYIEMTKAVHLSRMKSLFGDRYHWEVRQGGQSQAIAYCKKSDTQVAGGFIFEFGTPKRQAAGGDFKAAVHAIMNGMTIEEIAEEHPVPYVMYKEKLMDYAIEQKGKRNWAMDIHIFVGKTGCGKTYTAQNMDDGHDYYVCPWPTGGRWWMAGYTGQHTFIMDEWRGQLRLDILFKLFDRYHFTVESKGRNMHFVSNRIIITTNIEPKKWFPKTPRLTKEPLERRIQEFATIWDFSDGADFSWPDFRKVARTERFEFDPIEAETTFAGSGLGAYGGRYNYSDGM